MNNKEIENGFKGAVMCRIFKVGGWLDAKGFGKRINEIEVTETDKSFIGDGKRISKDKLMKIDTIFVENHKSIRYYTYCRDGEQQDALNMIKKHIIDKSKCQFLWLGLYFQSKTT
jgi:hypothetical protein